MLSRAASAYERRESAEEDRDVAWQVLLVEDNETDAELLKRTLRKQDNSLIIHHVGTLQDAVQAASSNKYQAILADLQLPDSDGIATVKEILSSVPQTPLIVLTGLDDENIAIQAVKSGAQDYLFKGTQGITMTIRSVRYAMERKRFHDRLLYLAHYDQLTGLANRSLFNQRLAQSISRSERTAMKTGLLYIDVDHFKQVNDTLGHESGDLLIKEIARRFSEISRDTDVVARLAGDEFAVILEGVRSEREAHAVATRMVSAFQKPFEISGKNIRCTISVGMALAPDDALSAKELMCSADAAMYQAKRSGRNSVAMFDIDSYRDIQARMQLLEELGMAIERHQFELFYQPQIDLRTGQVCAMEALIRWRHPERGYITPDKFIPLLEEEGRVAELGRWVIDEACRQRSVWRNKGMRQVRLAINISPKQLIGPDFLSHLHAALIDHCISPGELEFEITEHVFAEDTERIRVLLAKMRARGVRISIDDFGTGYSSLAYLRDFPIDALKVDQSFVRSACFKNRDAEITRAVISLGDILGLEVVAEGVEDQCQLDFLRTAGCNLVQGYLFGKAEPKHIAERWLASDAELNLAH